MEKRRNCNLHKFLAATNQSDIESNAFFSNNFGTQYFLKLLLILTEYMNNINCIHKILSFS